MPATGVRRVARTGRPSSLRELQCHFMRGHACVSRSRAASRHSAKDRSSGCPARCRSRFLQRRATGSSAAAPPPSMRRSDSDGSVSRCRPVVGRDDEGRDLFHAAAQPRQVDIADAAQRAAVRPGAWRCAGRCPARARSSAARPGSGRAENARGAPAPRPAWGRCPAPGCRRLGQQFAGLETVAAHQEIGLVQPVLAHASAAAPAARRSGFAGSG